MKSRAQHASYWYHLSPYRKTKGGYAAFLEIYQDGFCYAERINAGWYYGKTKAEVEAKVQKSLCFLKKKYQGILGMDEIIEEEKAMLDEIEKGEP